MKRVSRHVDAAAQQTSDTWGEKTPSGDPKSTTPSLRTESPDPDLLEG